MSIVQKADEWVMVDVEQRAWRVESRRGITPTTLARWTFVSLTFVMSAMLFLALNESTMQGLVLGTLMALLMNRLARHALRDFERRPTGTRNPLRDDWVGRILAGAIFATVFGVMKLTPAVLGAPFEMLVLTHVVETLLAIGCVYLLSCERMPPGFAEEEKGLVPSPA